MATHITTLNLKVAALEKDGGKTSGILDRWKDWALGALFAFAVWMVLKYMVKP